tara:strand:+ start:3165 stop:4037 length:873 start_codon:yes stop_codon:yes gene_type:complete
MATWKKVITENDNSTHKNDNITLAQLTTGLDGEGTFANGKVLKVDSGSITFADDSGGIAYGDLEVVSAGSASGSGSLTYDNSNGTFTFTRPEVGDGYFSQNSFTDADHTKLNGIATGADVTPTWVPSSDPSYLTGITTAQVKTALNADLGGSMSIGDANDTVTIVGNLTVSGTTTTINTTNLDIEDRVIKLNSGLGNTTQGYDIGMIVNRGSETNQAFFWDEAGDRWAVGSNHVNGQSFSVKNPVMTFTLYTDTTVPTGSDDGQGLGSMWVAKTAEGTNGNETEVYIRVH